MAGASGGRTADGKAAASEDRDDESAVRKDDEAVVRMDDETVARKDDETVVGYYRCIAPFFDLEQADRGDAPLWEWAASEPAGCRVLELGAGSGRATAFLARRAGCVVGIDISLALLARAGARLRGVRHVHLLAGDMRRLGLAARFDLVAAADDPFAHLLSGGERTAALAEAAGHLTPGGRLILDAAWLTRERRALAARAAGLVTERFRGGDGQLSVREEVHCTGRLCTTRVEYRRGDRRLGEASFRSRLWSLAELERRCREAGLRISELWGEFDRRPWSRQHSSRLIVEARAGQS